MRTILSEITLESLARKISLTERELLDLAETASSLYIKKRIPKKDKGIRVLDIPYSCLKKIQKQILTSILYKISIHPCLFGRPGTSIKDAVKKHVKKLIVITMDIKDFFPSTNAHMVKKSLIENGASEEISDILTRLITQRNHLPQGAPTSPCIGRIVLNPIAKQLGGYLSNIPRSDFSIYVDDIIISGPKGIKNLKNSITKIFKRNNYEIKKSKIYVMNRDKDQVSLGMKLNNGIEATEDFLRKIEQLEIKLPSNHPTLIGKKSFLKFLGKQ